MCHSSSFINFELFNSALIVGKVEYNELYSNGVGKTTIFKAIEYALFNQADVNLEKIIRDDTNSCTVSLDFIVDNIEYRVSRTRTKKGSTEVSLLQRKSQSEVSFKNDSKIWKDISGRRSADTEKELAKLIKTNYKSFRSTVHFLQNDLGGLSTATPEKRKGILKEALALNVYSKLEKIAKEQSTSISKDIDKHKILIDTLGFPDKDIITLSEQSDNIKQSISKLQSEFIYINKDLKFHNDILNQLNHNFLVLETEFSKLLAKEKSLLSEKLKINSSINEYQLKRSNLLKQAKVLTEEINDLKKNIVDCDFSQIETLPSVIEEINKSIITNSVNIQNLLKEYEELKIPLSLDSVCKHCRQPLTAEHIKQCKSQINTQLTECQTKLSSYKSDNKSLDSELNKNKVFLQKLIQQKKYIENVKLHIEAKEKELKDKRIYYEEYHGLIESFKSKLSDNEAEIENVKEELKNSSLEEANKVKDKISVEKSEINNINIKLSSVNKELAHLNNTLAVVSHTIEQKQKDLDKKNYLSNNLFVLENKYKVYPYILQAFSSTGIPNLIIQNVLDDLQVEANNLLAQLKPGLQLSFFIEKTKTDGTQDDTLDINYFVNGKPRDYEQLSGAMKLAVMFSLKLGLSFLLQKRVGTEIKLLLLDEIDQSLDKASVDAFAEIVKFFQNDFTILIITHNDRLKDKIGNGILVEQDINGVSTAKVVSNW